jgi:hypothetical protein
VPMVLPSSRPHRSRPCCGRRRCRSSWRPDRRIWRVGIEAAEFEAVDVLEIEDPAASLHAIADLRFSAIVELISTLAAAMAVGTGAAPDQVVAFTALERVGASCAAEGIGEAGSPVAGATS